MAYLQEIKIVEQGDAPVVGSTQQPNTIWIVNIYDKVCDMYASDNDGIVGLISEQIPVFESVEEALLGIPEQFRRIGKIVYITETLFDRIPIIDEEGKYILDEEGNVQYETISRDFISQYTFKDGLEDDNFTRQAPSLSDVMKTNNRVPYNTPIIFTSNLRPSEEGGAGWNEYDPNELRVWGGLDGTNFIANSRDKNDDPSVMFYLNTLIAANHKLERGQCNILIGGAGADAKEMSFTISIGVNSLRDFIGGFDSHTYQKLSHSYWGAATPNIAIGEHSGRGLKQGWGNIYIGNSTGGRPEVEDGKLVIHSGKYYNQRSNNPEHNFYPLILGDFLERWFQIAGQLRLNNKQNPTETDYSGLDEMAVLSNRDAEYTTQTIIEKPDGTPGTEKTTTTDPSHFKEVKTVDAKEYILHQIENMDEGQITRLKTALGLTE